MKDVAKKMKKFTKKKKLAQKTELTMIREENTIMSDQEDGVMPSPAPPKFIAKFKALKALKGKNQVEVVKTTVKG